MEEIVTCNICADVFDSLHFIPKMLECGHTFCSPCLSTIFKKSPICPNCRTEIKVIESSLPINYTTLKVVDIYKSKSWSEREIATSIEDMKKKLLECKDIISKKKTLMTSSLQFLDECLAKLEELTVSESQRVDAVNVKKIINEMDEDLKKTIDDAIPRDIKSSVSIRLSSFKSSKEYLIEIYKRVKNEEKVFAVYKVDDEIKYGKVSRYENRLFFHSLSLSEVPKDSFLIWLDELKQCVNKNNFYTFIEICCNEESLTRMVIIKMFDKQRSHHFIKTCTGECGPTYKGTSFVRGVDKENWIWILSVENGRHSNRIIDYDFCDEKVGFHNCKADKMFIFMPNIRGFEIILARKELSVAGMVGKVISPSSLNDSINYEHSSFLKIVDCGIILQI